MLADPGGWNHKLVTLFGASTAPDHQQSQPSAVLDDMALSRGFLPSARKARGSLAAACGA